MSTLRILDQTPGMLTARQAGRLARRARRRHADGSRGLLARRAWRRLAAAAPSDYTARWVFWVWEDSPDEESWEALAQWPEVALGAPGPARAAADDVTLTERQ
jgi:hypothetical protein